MPHEGHRERLRKKFLKYGADGLEKHEVLELLLFFSVPRKNTNEIAHSLINHFGSFSNVFDSPIDQIKQVDGVGDSSTFLIKLIPEICRIYMEDKSDRNKKIIDFKDIKNIIRMKFIGRNQENFVLTLMDKNMKLLFLDAIRQGNINNVDIYLDQIISLAKHYNAKFAIIAHNHPSGDTLPSVNDIHTTKNIRWALNQIDVKLLDHIIVTTNNILSLADTLLKEELFDY